MDTVNQDIGRRIRDIRKRLSLKGEDLGQILGVSKGAISAYERGEAKVSPAYLIRIAELGKVTLDWLVTGEESSTGVREEPEKYARDPEVLKTGLLARTIEMVEGILDEPTMSGRITPQDKARVI